MTDRYNYLTVVLEEPMRDDDAAALIAAISQLRGVASVAPNVAHASDYTAREMARLKLVKQLWDVLTPP